MLWSLLAIAHKLCSHATQRTSKTKVPASTVRPKQLPTTNESLSCSSFPAWQSFKPKPCSNQKRFKLAYQTRRDAANPANDCLRHLTGTLWYHLRYLYLVHLLPFSSFFAQDHEVSREVAVRAPSAPTAFFFLFCAGS
eukprot:TRINITY_DN37616_c0_g1_i1.p1 TRINITY_DN37616_c0_g1~~TRINITY_DN37616_c0_g1_i1.p1  ORF type:complete len:138 (+),score=10.27 TRINITY_DN37616_c0_g1_i1:42-455(+)